MRYIEDLIDKAYDIQAHINRIEDDNEDLKRQVEEGKRQRYFDVRPFMHPDGKLYTIKMVRALKNITLLEAKNLVDGWVRDGLLDGSSEFSETAEYETGDIVTHKGGTYRAKRHIYPGSCTGPASSGDTLSNGTLYHWEKTEPEALQFVKGQAYEKGDRVILNGVLVEAKDDIPDGACDGVVTGPWAKAGRLCIFDHWKRVGPDTDTI